MNDRIRGLLHQITALEHEIRMALHEQEMKMFFEIKGRRIEFENAVKKRIASSRIISSADW